MRMHMIIRRLAGAFSLVLLGSALAGCGLSSKGGPTGPAPGVKQVRGTVSRGAIPAAGVKVKLQDDRSGVQVDSVLTANDGAYGFDGVPAGSWMVKVSGPEATDLGYVRWFFAIASSGQSVVVPPFEEYQQPIKDWLRKIPVAELTDAVLSW